jgi:hypothetical protein
MKTITKENYRAITKLLTGCFLEDELVVKQTKGIVNTESFLEKLFFLQMTILHKTCEIKTLDDSMNSVIIGYEKKKYKPILVLFLSILCQFKLSLVIKSSDLKLFIKNCKETLQCVNLNWTKDYVEDNYYCIKIIAIEKNSRGKGIFRALIMPVIDYCKEKHIPIILETNTAENVPIYQHFGFEMIKMIPDKGSNFCQYCFIKQP